MILLCIDPGTTHSGVVIIDSDKDNEVIGPNSEFENLNLFNALVEGQYDECDHMAIEMVASYGMAVGQTTFETVLWTGHFMAAFGLESCTKVYRKDAALFLCNARTAKGSNIRQRIFDIYPATGGGKTPQKGTKKQPGPLYGVTSHSMSALAIGLTYLYSQDYLNLKGGKI